MTISLLFMGAIMVVVGVWLFKQSYNTQPWDAEARYASTEDFSGRSLPHADAKLGLFVLIAVITSLFALFISAYMMRMQLGDWRPLPDPDLLWINSAILVLSSAALQWASVAARQGHAHRARNGLVVGGIFAFAFMGGQLLAWQQLIGAGYLMRSNPANAFFYLITALHALHLLGGLVAWGIATRRLFRGIELERLRLSIELCALYWHFLLVVWVILFGLMLST